jgi:subfamily B ATP-binding cassette protein MsbA
MIDNEREDITRREKINSLGRVATFNPKLTVSIVILGVMAAGLEAIGLGFILPVISLIQSGSGVATDTNSAMELFVRAYKFMGVPLNLTTVIFGVSLVMTVRYTTSFLGSWLQAILKTRYVQHIQIEAFNHAMDAKISYFDQKGTDDILNAIITQTQYSKHVIQRAARLVQILLLAIAYLTIAFIISPFLTAYTIIFLGGLTYLFRRVIEPGYELGEKVAEANEERQSAAQSGVQGIRDIRIFGIANEIKRYFVNSTEKYTSTTIKLSRNEEAISSFYNLSVVISIFVLIYAAFRIADLSFASIGVFLFAMLQLGPRASTINQYYYKVENDLPHLVRTHRFIKNISMNSELDDGQISAPSKVECVEFNNVGFSYTEDERILQKINFEVKRDEFVAFVGQSGAGKSTIASLLARLYEPDRGEITANGKPIQEMDPQDWREHLAMVRQKPYIFNESLRYNLTIANEDANKEDINYVCGIARIDEFLEDLPEGLDTLLGDNGVRLSGGQKQRVAIARALLSDSEILILDEATSDLDNTLEKAIQDAIENMDNDYLIITIAHRLSTVKSADRIYVIENGQIVNSGRHTELLEGSEKYAELYNYQVALGKE